MKLYLIHCGYYDSADGLGIYEAHTNILAVAPDVDAAKMQVRFQPDFQARKMHIDGVIEIQAVDGYRVGLTYDETLDVASILISSRQRDLAPKAATS